MAEVLIVDGDPSTRNVLHFLLSLDGHRVAEAATGSDARRSLRDSTYDFVFVDLALPDMNGRELLKDLEWATGTRIAVLSGKDLRGAHLPAAARIVARLLKPKTTAGLVASVVGTLARLRSSEFSGAAADERRPSLRLSPSH